MNTRATTSTVLPMQFTDPDAAHRARERADLSAAEDDAAAFARSREHNALMHAHRQIGHDEGHAEGFKAGYMSGVNWGFICGALSTLCVAGVILLWVRA